MTPPRKPDLLEFFQSMETGIQQLREDMEKYPSFDPSHPYKEKNFYAHRANELGRALMHWGEYRLAEAYFFKLLYEVEAYEYTSDKAFNKGMITANYAICQLMNGNVDFGVTHLLAAEKEDKPVQPDFNILNTSLWRQFEEGEVFSLIERLTSRHIADFDFQVNTEFLDRFFQHLEDRSDRIYIEVTLLKLRTGLNIVRYIGKNDYVLGELLAGLRNLCLIIEVLLKKKNEALQCKTLTGCLIAMEFPGLKNGSVSANNIEQLLKKHSQKLLFDDPTLRTIHMLALTRNFTSHNFYISGEADSSDWKTFFDQVFENLLSEVLMSMFYLKHTEKI